MLEIADDVIEVQKDTKLDDCEYVEIRDPYGFIYITTNLVNGKRYLGLKRFDKKWKNYIGSGMAFKKAVEKYGKENFKRDIIDVAYSEEELNQKEYEYSVFFNVIESSNWYNLVLGGGSTNGYQFSKEQRQKMSKMRKGKPISENARQKISESKMGHYTSDETKSKIGDANRGRALTDEHIEKIRKGNLGKTVSEDARRKIGNANRGKKYTNRVSTQRMGPFPILIYCVELDMLFCGLQDANNKTGADIGHINACCRNSQYRKSAGKHPVTGEKLHWKYAYDQIQNNEIIVQGAITLGYITEEQVNNYLQELREKENNTNGTMEKK